MRDTLIIAAMALGLMVFTETLHTQAHAASIQPMTIAQVEIVSVSAAR